MQIAFLTESNFFGKVPLDHINMRTEMAWQAVLQSDHFNIHQYEQVKEYDVVFVIFPKASVKLNREGIEMTSPKSDKDNSIFGKPVIETLKSHNGKICFVQEGPNNYWVDYDILTQFNFYNQLAECDIIFAHNEYDTHFYKGLFPQTKIAVIPSLMLPIDIIPVKEDKTIISGNWANWYGGFQSYIVAAEFGHPIYVPSSHCKRPGEEQIPGIKHLPWVMWSEWMKILSTFKYAVSMMPTIAAGTFQQNCGYFGIPVIGNEKVDTQQLLFPELSVDVNDIHMARHLARQLVKDKFFYDHVCAHAKHTLKDSWHLDQEKWLEYIKEVLNE